MNAEQFAAIIVTQASKIQAEAERCISELHNANSNLANDISLCQKEIDSARIGLNQLKDVEHIIETLQDQDEKDEAFNYLESQIIAHSGRVEELTKIIQARQASINMNLEEITVYEHDRDHAKATINLYDPTKSELEE